jgi:antitoxin component of RelBE/YafQ-DinJ toxin-antitoxin module
LLNEKEKKMSHIQIRIEESLKKRCQQAAANLSLPLAAWIRVKLIEALQESEEDSR